MKKLGLLGGWTAILALLLSISVSGQAVDTSPASGTPSPHSGWSFRALGLTPIQSGGRVKPLDSFARETVLFLTQSQRYQGWEPMDLLLSWVVHPDHWKDVAFLKVTHQQLQTQLLLDRSKQKFSPLELMKNPVVIQYAEEKFSNDSNTTVTAKEKESPREKELKDLIQRLTQYQEIISGDAFLLIPKSEPHPWGSLGINHVAMADQSPEAEAIRNAFKKVVTAYYEGKKEEFEKASEVFASLVEKSIPAWSESSRSKLKLEEFYNQLRPFHWSWILYVIAALLLGISVWGTGSAPIVKSSKFFGILIAAIAFVIHVGGFLLRSWIAGRPPVSNMYESIIWVSFGVMLFGWILLIRNRHFALLATACAVAGFTLVAADFSPAVINPEIHPLVPVLRSNFWLTVHVLTITLGYAAFALTLGLADVTLFHYLKSAAGDTTPGRIAKINLMNDLTYKSMQFGVVLLAAGTILGGVWADYSWGRFWGWDPKEVWALIALLCYLTILHGRFTGWVGQFGYPVWTIIAFLSVLMSWYGVNFVLGVGLHSYGFATGGNAFVITFVSMQLAYVGFVAFFRKQAQKRKVSGP